MTWMLAPFATAVIFLGAMVLAARAHVRWFEAQTITKESRMLVSTTTMIKRLEGMLDTRDLTDWEKSFVQTLVEAQQTGKVTQLTGAQIDKLDQLHGRHFA